MSDLSHRAKRNLDKALQLLASRGDEQAYQAILRALRPITGGGTGIAPGALPDLGGDATGRPDANTVTKIQNIAVSTTDPTADQVLKYNGTAWAPATMNAGHTIEDEGTPLTQRSSLNFTGAGVTVTDTGGKTTVTIPTGGHVIQDEGVSLTQRSTLNFVGDDVVVTDDSGGGKTLATITGAIRKALVLAKGDLIAATASGLVARLAAGTNGQIIYADSTQTTGLRWGAPPTTGSVVGTYLVSGGQVTWQSGYTYLVAAGTGYINGAFVSWAQQTITLDAADPSLDRIDVIAVNSSATVVKITGTAASNPSEPVTDPGTQLKLSIVTVDAGTASPTVTTELVYAENAGASAEWNWTTSGTGWTLASTTNPRSGTKDIEGTTVAVNAYVQGERGSGTIDPTAFEQLVLYLRFKSSWGQARFLQVSIRNAGVQVGNALRISNGFFGLDGTNITTYQAVIIPTLQFAASPGEVINQIRIQALGTGGTAIGCYLDDVSFTTSGTVVVGAGGLTQDEADARYLRRALNLSDLEDAAEARTNLGINQLTIQEVDGAPSETEPTTLEFPNGTLSEPSAGVVRYTPAVGTDTDEKAKVSSNDTTAGYLNGKLVAGSNITLTENNDGGNETLTIAASGSGSRWEIVVDGSVGGFIWAESGGVAELIYAEVP